jgi:hypothetical protein
MMTILSICKLTTASIAVLFALYSWYRMKLSLNDSTKAGHYRGRISSIKRLFIPVIILVNGLAIITGYIN